MDTYKLICATGDVLFPYSTAAGDLENEEVIRLAKEAGAIPEDCVVQDVEHWPGYDRDETIPVHFVLDGQFTCPKGLELLETPGGGKHFKLPNGNILRIQIVMEQETPGGEYEDLGTCALEDLGILDFGEFNGHIVKEGS